ncbi:hypothetical protein [Saccharospirillum mangrovi]|uniref:hypothetical protein n=1 Tax=Saccharospirillum mangrovi TaxID=2161747 RepID=UPI000D33BD12|nr:hypothetical protein [Saccharospirillum mangrovi]
MPRPRFRIGTDDWFDALDWLDYQLAQPSWLVANKHPIHQLGLAHFKEQLRLFRNVEEPGQGHCDDLQAMLNDALERGDWDRLRKTLSARRRRRREKRTNQGPVNLTLSGQAHQWLKQLAQAGQHSTLSAALEFHLPDLVAQLEADAQAQRAEAIEAELADWSQTHLLAAIEAYLARAAEERSLATACRIAYQWYQREPDVTKAGLLRERFIEDLVWNEAHLKRPASEFLSVD